MPPSGIYARHFPALDRYVQLGIASRRVLSVSFPSTAESDARTDHELLDRITGYLDGNHESFQDVNVALTIPTTQRSVLETLRSIPYGEQVSIDQLVGMTPNLDPETPDDHETVRQALTANPTPLLIADHRVTDGPSAAPSDVRAYLQDLEDIS